MWSSRATCRRHWPMAGHEVGTLLEGGPIQENENDSGRAFAAFKRRFPALRISRAGLLRRETTAEPSSCGFPAPSDFGTPPQQQLLRLPVSGCEAGCTAFSCLHFLGMGRSFP